MSIHDPTLYVGFPTPLLAGHIRTHSVETAVVLAPASPTCPSVTMTRLPQGSRTREKIMIHWYHLIASAYVLIIVLHFCIILEFSIPFQVQCTWQIAKIHGLDWERGRKQHLLDLVLLLEFLVLLLEHLCLRQGQKGWCSHGCECHQLV